MRNIRTILSNNLEKFRKDKGLSQMSLAERAGLSQDVVSAVERMKNWPSVPTLEKLAKALNVNPEILLTPSGSTPLVTNSEILERVAYGLKISQGIDNELLNMLYELREDDLESIRNILTVQLKLKKTKASKNKELA
jgi:transcriptional regulator with XRE-family HTH domain